jgi:Uma2 family endonuclease
VMPGGMDRHNRIAINAMMQVLPAALSASYQAYMNDVLIRTPDETGYYPDVFVVCDST